MVDYEYEAKKALDEGKQIYIHAEEVSGGYIQCFSSGTGRGYLHLIASLCEYLAEEDDIDIETVLTGVLYYYEKLHKKERTVQ